MRPGPFPTRGENDADPGDGHGTSMASTALGKRDGTAKKADLIMARSDRWTEGREKLSPLIWLDALRQVYDDIKDSHEGKALVSMSVGFSDAKENDDEYKRVKNLSNAFKDLYAKIIKPLIADLDTPTFIAAGNEAFNSPIVNDIPAVLGGPIPDLIVVGAVDEDRDRDRV